MSGSHAPQNPNQAHGAMTPQPGAAHFHYEQQQHYDQSQTAFQVPPNFINPVGVPRYSTNPTVTHFPVAPGPEHASHVSIPLPQAPSSLPLVGSTTTIANHSDLRGLNVERYDQNYSTWKADASAAPTPATAIASHRAQNTSPWASESNSSRTGKRNRRESLDVAAKSELADDEVKRARGRPRLQTTDQTPSERRRTQIRLAQRAYRSRKENAMNDLEDQVKALKDANAEMTEAIQKLCDYASQYDNSISQIPELSNHIQRLRVLSRGSAKKRKSSVRSDSSASEDRAHTEMSEHVIKSEHGKQSRSPDHKISGQPQHLFGGIVVTYEADGHQHQSLQAHDYGNLSHNGTSEYEVIAVPTPENASFAPNKINLNANFLQSMPWGANPQLQAFPQSGFSRRLSRHAREKAAALINTTDPPTEKMLSAFGFSALFESTENIRKRVNDEFQRSRDDNLYNMQFQYYSLGGAGHQLPHKEQQFQSSGSSNFQSHDGSYRPGLPDVKLSDMRNKLLDISKTMQSPGSRTVFWDCDEVDLYLSQRGVNFPDGADSFTAEIIPMTFLLDDAVAQQQPRSSDVVGNSEQSDMSMSHAAATVPSSGPLPPSPALSSTSPRKMVRIDVNKFLDDLTSQAVLFGRTLGFRPHDVNQAFWRAATE